MLTDREIKGFTCRCCGSTEPVIPHSYKNRVVGPGHRESLLYYSCSGCGVMFINLEKFSTTALEKPVSTKPA